MQKQISKNEPIKPKLLANTAKIKSVCGSGKYKDKLNQCPNKPAEPIDTKLFSN